jgi:hypothetical protein
LPFYYFARQGIDVDAAFEKDCQAMVAVEDFTILARFETAWVAAFWEMSARLALGSRGHQEEGANRQILVNQRPVDSIAGRR